MKVPCALCADPVDPSDEYTYQRVAGWSKPRKKGLNGLTNMRRLPKFAHYLCVERVRLGLPVQQEEMSLI